MVSVLERRPSFESLVSGRQGVDIPEKHRFWLELAKDHRLTALEGASDQLRAYHDLRIHQAMRRAMDVRVAAMRSGYTVFEVLRRHHIRRSAMSKQDDDRFARKARVVEPEQFEADLRASEARDDMDRRDVIHRSRARSDALRERASEDLSFPTRYTQAVDEALESSPNRFGPIEGVLRDAGDVIGETIGTGIGGNAIGGGVGKAGGRAVGRAFGAAADGVGAAVATAGRTAAWAPFSWAGFQLEDSDARDESAKKRHRRKPSGREGL